MKFDCSHCSQRLSAEPTMVGQQISCPVCANTITIPPPQPEAEVQHVPQKQISPAPVTAHSKVPSSTPPPRRRLPVVALAATIILLGLAAGAFFFLRSKGGGLNVIAALTGPPPTEIRVYPTDINLTTKNDRQSVVVQALYADGLTRDVTADASFSLANKALAKVEKGLITPLADGKTDLQIKYGGKE